MSLEVYEAALALLERSGIPEARLLGGEPTEHPRFCEYVARALKLGFRVVVFSGGLVPQPVLEFIAALPAASFSVVLNAADQTKDAEALVIRQRQVCLALGKKVVIGVNIRSANENPTYVLDWVREYDLSRTVRVGIAHPIWGGANDFFRLRGPRVISVFERLVADGAAMGINVGFDCGFTPCMFSKEFVDAHADMFMPSAPGPGAPTTLGRFTKRCIDPSGVGYDTAGLQAANSDGSVEPAQKAPATRMKAVGVRCSPVVDILPEGDCIACYALSRFRRLPLPAKGHHNDLVSFFDAELSPVLPAGVHRECPQCDYQEKDMCSGGCRARRALRLRPNALIPLDPEPMGESTHT
jgi:hypothetical protein